MACHSWSRGPPETECPRGRGREAGNNGIAQLQPAGLQENQPAFSIPPSTWQGPILCQLRSQLVRACACVCVCARLGSVSVLFHLQEKLLPGKRVVDSVPLVGGQSTCYVVLLIREERIHLSQLKPLHRGNTLINILCHRWKEKPHQE